MNNEIKQEQSQQLKEIGFGNFPAIVSNWFRYFLKKWWLIGLFVIAGGVLGVVIATMEKIKYESRLTFALDDGGGGSVGGALSLASSFGLDIGGSKDMFSGDNILEILKSRRIIQRVLLLPDTVNGHITSMADELMEIENFKEKWDKNPRLNSVSFPINLPISKFSYLQDSVSFVLYNDVVLKNLTAQKPDKKLSIYELKFISLNERFAKYFTSKLIIEASSFYTELRNKHSKEVLGILESRVAQMRGSAQSAINSKASIQDANVNPAFYTAQAPLQNKQLDITVYGGAYAELYRSQELARYRYLQSTPLLQMIDEPQYPMKKLKRGRLKTGAIYGASALCIILFLLFMVRLFKKETT